MATQGPSQLRARGQRGVSLVNDVGVSRPVYTTRSAIGPGKGQMPSARAGRSRPLAGEVAATGNAYTVFVVDAVTVNDSLATVCVSVFGVSDTVAVSDAAVSGFRYPGSVADTVTVTDSLTNVLTQVALVADAVTVAESVACPRILGVATVDTVTVSDSGSMPQTYSLAVTDTIGVNDSVVCGRALGASVSDTVSVADALAQDQAVPVTDTLTVTDAALAQVSPVLDLADAITTAEGVTTLRVSTALCVDTMFVTDTVDILQSSASTIYISEVVSLDDDVAVVARSPVAGADTVVASDTLGLFGHAFPALAETLPLAVSLGATAQAQASTSGTTLLIDFGREVPWPSAAPFDAYRLTADGGAYPLTLRRVDITTFQVAQGASAQVTAPRTVVLGDMAADAALVGRYLTLTSARNPVTVRVVAQAGTTIEVDQPLYPEATPQPWRADSGAIGAVLTTTKMTRGGAYTLTTSFGLVLPFTGQAPRPTLVSVAFQVDDGTVLLTFSDPMREDKALTDPAEYAVTGPSAVEVRRVRTLSPTQVLLETSGLGAGAYTLTVNATGTPKDLAGNPMDPGFNQAVFQSLAPLSTRSVFTDHGPIARPPLVLQTGVGVTLTDATTVVLTGGGLSSALVGRTLRLVGTTKNDGDFRILSVLTPTRCKVAASFSRPDTGASMAVWSVIDPRHGQIADDPSHVRVRVNGSPVVVESVIGLLGQVVLATAPTETDVVKVDYSWVRQPTVEVQRLNSREFRLNGHARILPGGSDHTYAYQNVLVAPSDYTPSVMVQAGTGAVVTAPNTVSLTSANVLAGYVGLTLLLGGANEGVGFRIVSRVSATVVTVSPNPALGAATAWQIVDDQGVLPAPLAQPLQRDLKYRAYERAYTATLNDPTRLVLNTPLHRVAYPPLQRTLDESFINYQPATLPDLDPLAPWTRLGQGTASLSGDRLVVEDTTTGPFPGGEPFFWQRPIDTTFPHVLAMTWQVEVPEVPTADGVWSGLAVGYGGPERALVVGFLTDGGVPKVGVLRAGAGNDPSALSAWTGGLDSSNVPTFAPMPFDWASLHSYRVLRGADGVIRVYFDGAVVESLRVLESELPFLAELNDPFDQVQGVFFGSLSRQAQSQSVWDYVRYTVLPTNPLQVAPSVFVTYEGNEAPEAATPLWTPVGYHGTETILPSGALLLDSTSATTEATSTKAGLVGGDFRGYLRLEPLLAASSDVVLDAMVQVRTHTHGPRPDAVMLAADDGTRLLQLSLFPDRAAPLLGYGGRSLPTDWDPTPWTALGGSGAAMAGRTLRITDTDINDGRVYYVEDTTLPASDARVVGPGDFIAEMRVKVVSTTPDPDGFAGATLDVYDSTRALGLLLQEVAGVRYVAFHSEGVMVTGGQVAFDWFDGQPHTYRLAKSAGGNLVTLFIDSVFAGSVAYTDFAVPAASSTGVVSFGSATGNSMGARSVIDWSYVNTWRVLTGVKRYAGLWKGTTTGSLRDFHLPLRALGQGAVGGNVLSDPSQNFVALGVTAGDQLVVDDGPNAGVYEVTAATTTSVVVSTVFPAQPSVVDYRLPREVDWSAAHRYRLVRSPDGVVTVLLDSDAEPLIRVDVNTLTLPASGAGVVTQLSAGMPAVAWGALDPTALTETAWAYVRYGITRSPTELRIVPQGMVLNQRNVMASPEHIFTKLPHAHTDFWAGSDGIPPKTSPDFLRDPGLVAFTLLNEGTPLVPSTQTAEVRHIQPSKVFVSALNTPEDVLNIDGDFTLNDGTTKIQIVYPDDVLYSALDVIEKQTGQTSLIAPFDDRPTFGGVQYQKEVCLSYDASTLPEQDTSASTPWSQVSDDASQVSTTVFNGVLTYGTTGATRTVYRNATPLTDAPGLTTEVSFRLKVVQDGTFGLGDSQIRLGLSAAPNVTAALAFLTSPLGQRYVLLVDLTSQAVMAGILFDWYDGQFHTYRLTRDPGAGVLSVSVAS